MSDISLTVRLPQELVKRAEEAQIRLDDAGVARLIEAALLRNFAAESLRNAMSQLQGSLTLEEIEAELEADKAERIASQSS
jgi:hypothetical protein